MTVIFSALSRDSRNHALPSTMVHELIYPTQPFSGPVIKTRNLFYRHSLLPSNGTNVIMNFRANHRPIKDSWSFFRVGWPWKGPILKTGMCFRVWYHFVPFCHCVLSVKVGEVVPPQSNLNLQSGLHNFDSRANNFHFCNLLLWWFSASFILSHLNSKMMWLISSLQNYDTPVLYFPHFIGITWSVSSWWVASLSSRFIGCFKWRLMSTIHMYIVIYTKEK